MTFSIPHLSTKFSEAKASIVLNTTFLLNEIKQKPTLPCSKLQILCNFISISFRQSNSFLKFAP